MTFERSFDLKIIRDVMRNPALYERCADDFSPAREAFEPRTDPGIWYVLARDGQVIYGLFALAPQNTICWEIHTRLLPASWGAIAATAAAGVVPWIWENTGALRLVTMCPAYNRLAIRFAERAGLVRYGVNPDSWQKHGKLHDQVLLGISK